MPRAFEGIPGENEGIARRLAGNVVEVATGYGSRDDIPKMNFDRHKVETWEYQKGAFVKKSEVNVPHLLKSREWKSHYEPF